MKKICIHFVLAALLFGSALGRIAGQQIKPFQPEDLIPYKSKEKWGYINYKGEQAIPPQFDLAGPFSEGLASIRINEREGYIDSRGKIIVEAVFQSASSFSEGLASVQIENKWGYIDRAGNRVIKPQFDRADSFSEGLAAVSNVNKNWGYINKDGQFVIQPKYELAGPFAKGLARVKFEGKWSYINTKGELKGKFDRASQFSEGLAFAQLGNTQGYIDTNIKMIITGYFTATDRNPKSFIEGGMFSEGYAAVLIDKKWGYIDAKGMLVIKPQFDFARQFSEGLAAVRSIKWGYIDKKGTMVIDQRFDEAGPFSRGRARVVIGGLVNYVDSQGQIVLRGTRRVGSAGHFEHREDFPHKSAKFVSYNRTPKVARDEPCGLPCDSTDPAVICVWLDSIPTGAKVWLVPRWEWEHVLNICVDEVKREEYRVTEGSTCVLTYRDERVFFAVFDLDGKIVSQKLDVIASIPQKSVADFRTLSADFKGCQ